MDATPIASSFLSQIITSGRIVLGTMFLCCVVYVAAVYGFAQVVTPVTAEGSLLRDARGVTVGSALIAQEFHSPKYFRSRPSAVKYNASAAGGSNLSPANPELRSRALAILAQTQATAASPMPADLVTASGSGLDPHISEAAALYQLPGVAAARGLSPATVKHILRRYTTRSTPTSQPLVNVLLLNLALDKAKN